MLILKIKTYAIRWLLIFISCNTIFIAMYFAAAFIPSDNVIKQLNNAFVTGVLKAPEYSVGRSTTGLGIDFGTECVALGIGLRSNPNENRADRLWSRFNESYLSAALNSNQFDPCAGLVEIIRPGNELKEVENLQSYARNWWGMSIVIQVGVSLFGLATLKSYLYGLMIISMLIFYQKFSKFMRNYAISFFLLGPFILMADFQDLYNVAPYSIFTIQMFLFGIILLNVMRRTENQEIRIFEISVVFGCVYNFMFWFNFHLIITFIPIVIYLICLGKFSQKQTMGKIINFLIGFISGFALTTVLKWGIAIVIFGGEVSDQVKKSLSLRLSTSQNNLNGPLLNYSSAVDFLPLPLKAVYVNFLVYASKFVDPRNTSVLTIILLLFVLILLISLFLKKINFSIISGYRELIPATPIFLIPFLYYMLTANHSFNHATLTYRALPLLFGLLLSLLYLSHLKDKRTV